MKKSFTKSKSADRQTRERWAEAATALWCPKSKLASLWQTTAATPRIREKRDIVNSSVTSVVSRLCVFADLESQTVPGDQTVKFWPKSFSSDKQQLLLAPHIHIREKRETHCDSKCDRCGHCVKVFSVWWSSLAFLSPKLSGPGGSSFPNRKLQAPKSILK